MGSPDTILRRLIDEGFSGGRLEVADELIAPDVIEHQDYGPGHAPGAEGVKAVMRSLRRAFSEGNNLGNRATIFAFQGLN